MQVIHTYFYSHTHTPLHITRFRTHPNKPHSNTTPTHPTRKQIESHFCHKIITMLKMQKHGKTKIKLTTSLFKIMTFIHILKRFDILSISNGRINTIP